MSPRLPKSETRTEGGESGDDQKTEKTEMKKGDLEPPTPNG